MERKNENIQIRVTFSEKKVIQEQSSKVGLNMSDYIRYCIMKELSKKITPERGEPNHKV